MGSVAAQRYVIDHSHEVDGLVLSGSGALDGLARAVGLAPAGSNLLNAAFEPARTRLTGSAAIRLLSMRSWPTPSASRTSAPKALASFLGTAPRLCDPVALRKIRRDLPILFVLGSEDPRRAAAARAHVLIDRYRECGGYATSRSISIRAGDTRLLNEINRRDRPDQSARLDLPAS